MVCFIERVNSLHCRSVCKAVFMCWARYMNVYERKGFFLSSGRVGLACRTRSDALKPARRKN